MRFAAAVLRRAPPRAGGSPARRVIAISAGGIYGELPESFKAWDEDMVGEYRPINLRAAHAMEQSSLDYTVLHPVWLIDKPTEAFQLTRKGETYKGTEMSRRKHWRCVADIVTNPELYRRECPGISQAATHSHRSRHRNIRHLRRTNP